MRIANVIINVERDRLNLHWLGRLGEANHHLLSVKLSAAWFVAGGIMGYLLGRI